MMYAIFKLFVLSNITSVADRCCLSCNLPEFKYFYIDKDTCAETCLKPNEYPYFKKLYPTLTQDTKSSLPCETYNFHLYDHTEEKGKCPGPFCSEFDIYDKDIYFPIIV